MEVIAAYNLVVDSNIETPAGRSPTAAHIGVLIHNTGTTPVTQEGGLTDATRFIPVIQPGDKAVVYWLVSYPVMDANGKTVAGAAADPDDDLQLNYAVWVDGYENGVTQRRAYEQRHMTCRNKLSAMANKIWLNTTAKVPNEYLDAKASTTRSSTPTMAAASAWSGSRLRSA